MTRSFDEGPRLGAVFAVLYDRAVKANDPKSERFKELTALIDGLNREFPEEKLVERSAEARQAMVGDTMGQFWMISIAAGDDLRTPRHSGELAHEVFFDIEGPPLPVGVWCVVDYDGWRYLNCPVETMGPNCCRIRIDQSLSWYEIAERR